VYLTTTLFVTQASRRWKVALHSGHLNGRVACPPAPAPGPRRLSCTRYALWRQFVTCLQCQKARVREDSASSDAVDILRVSKRCTFLLATALERKKKLYSKLHLHSIQTLQNIDRQRRSLERHAHQDPRGRIRGFRV